MPPTRCLLVVAILSTALTNASLAETECATAPPLALGRPQTDFVQWQTLTGRVLGPSNSLPGVKGTPLSYDARGTRAVSVMFEFPAGWVMDRPHYVNSDQEFLVLAGELKVDGLVYRAGDYAYLPAGFAHSVLRSPRGATVLNFYEGEHLAFYAASPPGMYQARKLIRRIDTATLRWQRSPSGGQRKLLRRDQASGGETWLQKEPASATAAAAPAFLEPLDTVAEFYLLDGELSTPLGMFKPGAYAWRAPNTTVGPVSSATGYTALLRSKGGRPHGRRSRRRSGVAPALQTGAFPAAVCRADKTP